jgi:putative tryptophan/tyrosine transport system substrate-binding protein
MKHSLSVMIALALVSGAEITAQGPPKAPTIGIVYTSPHPVINDIIEGFKEVVSRQFPDAQFVERHANGNESEYNGAVLSVLSRDLTLLAPITTPISKIAVAEARGRTPIVFMGVTDPVGAGIADSIEKPTKSTGSSDLCPFDALLALARQVRPDARLLAVPYNPSDQPAVFGLGRIRALAPKFGFSVIDRQVTSRNELDTEVRGIAGRADAVLLAADNLMMENPALVASAAASQGKPVFACDTTSVEKGAVAGVSVQYRDVGRAAGELAVKVLNGTPPGSLPVAVLSSGGVSVNRKAACDARVELPTAALSGATVLNADYACPTNESVTPFMPAVLVLGATALAIVAVVAARRRARRQI